MRQKYNYQPMAFENIPIQHIPQRGGGDIGGMLSAIAQSQAYNKKITEEAQQAAQQQSGQDSQNMMGALSSIASQFGQTGGGGMLSSQGGSPAQPWINPNTGIPSSGRNVYSSSEAGLTNVFNPNSISPLANTNQSTGQSPIGNVPSINQLMGGLGAVFPNNPNMQGVGAAQAILESGLMGKPSNLASEYGNIFGIKSPGTGGSVNMPTKEYMNNGMQSTNSDFGVNKNWLDSLMQYKNLMQKPRYKSVMSAKTPEEAFMSLSKAGYATDPNYVSKLSSVYKKYVLPKLGGIR
jgi:hypothetical protein